MGLVQNSQKVTNYDRYLQEAGGTAENIVTIITTKTRMPVWVHKWIIMKVIML